MLAPEGHHFAGVPVVGQARRCLVPMDGYYRWKPAAEAPAGTKGRKTPFYIYREGRPATAHGGLVAAAGPRKVER